MILQSTIRVDPRHGSDEFNSMLVRLGAPAKLKMLEFADFRFRGNARQGRVRVGVERKTVSEMCDSISGGRFINHQLPGLLRTYPGHAWLVVEGRAYPAKDGVLMQGKFTAGFGARAHSYRVYTKHQITLRMKAGIQIVRTENKEETAQFVYALWDWYQQPYARHGSCFDVEESNSPDAAILQERTFKRRIANQCPQVDWKRSLKVARHFTSAQAMANGTVEDWRRALRFKKGTKIAQKIVDSWKGQR